MERNILAVKAMVEKYGPKDLAPLKWMKHEKVRGFTEFVVNSDKEPDLTSFDNKEMCEYTRKEPENKGQKVEVSGVQEQVLTFILLKKELIICSTLGDLTVRPHDSLFSRHTIFAQG